MARAWATRSRLRLGALLSAPLAWLVVLYIGSLVALFVTSLFSIDPFTFKTVNNVSGGNFRELATTAVYRNVTLRTVGVAAAVTLACMAIAVPVAFFMAKVAKPRWRRALVTAVVIPLWASYLVKAFAWRLILDPADSVLKNTIGWAPGFNIGSVVIVMSYLWLPYMILPVYAGFERLPDSLLEASSDLGGRAGRTFRSVVLPIVLPALAAGSIFTFSLTLGDYIAVGIVGGKTQMIGNVIYSSFGVPNVPFAAAFALVPVVIMLGYLLAVRRTGAFENL
jgi:putative spermidine/putrescine transport system permease protein